MSSLKRFEGELQTDHFGPGVQFYSPTLHSHIVYPGEKTVREATLWCSHCSTCFLPNPDRDRPREYCRKCDAYLCDCCARTASKPGYLHRSFKEVRDLVQSGKWTLVGPVSDQNLIPTSIEVIAHG